jgi:hypothetical protein
MDIDLDKSVKDAKGKTNESIHDQTAKTDLIFEEEVEDKILAFALSVWVGLLQVATPKQLKAWCEDRAGLCASDKAWQTKKNRKKAQSSQKPLASPPCGGLFMVCLLLDLLEELQFDRWMSEDDPSNPLAFSQLLSTRVLPDERKLRLLAKNRNGKGNQSQGCDENGVGEDASAPSSSSTIIPEWYGAAIAVLSQMGRTRDGMRILRSRTPDDYERSDWMGNALDVSIRQLHTLALHLEDFRFRHGSILRFEEEGADKSHRENEHYNDDDLLRWGADPLGASLLRSVEAWVRLWHQVLLFAQSSGTAISFRSLVLDLQDWFTSTCTTLLASDELRREIKVMVRWQLDELAMDEEDYEEQKHSLISPEVDR